jgi:hypothetical protein
VFSIKSSPPTATTLVKRSRNKVNQKPPGFNKHADEAVAQMDPMDVLRSGKNWPFAGPFVLPLPVDTSYSPSTKQIKTKPK